MIRNNRTITIVLTAASVIALLGLVSLGTFALLRHVKPAGMRPLSQQSDSHSTTAAQTGDAIRKKAEQYWQRGDLSNAKSAYQSAYDTYTTEHNAAAAADAKIQIAILDKKLASQHASIRP